LLTIPNSTIAAASIDNMGARSFRRYKTAVLIHYRTPLTHLADLRDRLREWLADHPHVRRDKIDVAVQSLGEKGIELVLSVYLSAPDGAEETRLRDEINCEVLRAAEMLGVGLAAAGAPAVPVPEHREKAA
jgi:MscS family membrane protein